MLDRKFFSEEQADRLRTNKGLMTTITKQKNTAVIIQVTTQYCIKNQICQLFEPLLSLADYM